jgi:bifunctional UDP-N-acetylglucosamine pyrophosphorylase / glucosamine-1-phosphate N-acetyltransferase
VLHLLAGRPLLAYVVDTARAVGSERTVAVVGHQAERVRALFRGSPLIFVDQHEQLGTGHAVLQTLPEFARYDGMVLILCGDVPLLLPSTVARLRARHRADRAVVTVLTTRLENPSGYGRVIKNERGEVLRIVEERDGTPAERAVREINTGIYCVAGAFLFRALAGITNDNAQGEYYLTDVVAAARREGLRVSSLLAPDPEEVMGINTPEELARAELSLRRREQGP